MKPVQIAALAQDEVREARDWFEGRLAGLGAKLIASVDRVLVQVAENPQRYPIVHRDIRRVLVRTFPYAVFYREVADHVRVIAIVHQHRDPKSWQRRL